MINEQYPEFIPYYIDVQYEYGLNERETLIYGLIRLFKGEISEGNIMDILRISKDKYKNSLNTLKNRGLIAKENES
jgi:predicted transcriptional regulator